MKGHIIRVEADRGFAFIRDENGLSRFAHARSFEPRELFDLIREKQLVEFEPIEVVGRGLRAERVRECQP